MKKRKILLVSLLLIVILIGISAIRKKIKNTVSTSHHFVTSKKADFYLVSSDGIKSFGIERKEIKEINSEKYKIADYPNELHGKAEFDDRYLVFSDDDGFGSSGISRPIISIDFKDGKIRKSPTPNFGYSGGGYSDDYFYTHQATTGDGGIFSFNKYGKKVDSYHFDSLALGTSKFVGKNGVLFFEMTHNPTSGDPDDNYENSLLIFDEKPKLKLVNEILLEDSSTYTYMLNSTEIVGNSLYITNPLVRDRKTKETIPDNRIMVIDTKTYEKNFIELSEPYPSEIFKSKDSKRMFITHPPTMLGKSLLTVYDIEEKSQYQIDISKLSGSDDAMLTSIVSVNTTKDNKLLILTHENLFVYDLEQKELLSSLNMPEKNNEHIYIWAN
jgi:hypothetical protein